VKSVWPSQKKPNFNDYPNHKTLAHNELGCRCPVSLDGPRQGCIILATAQDKRW